MRLLFVLLLGLGTAINGLASRALDHARRAQALLGSSAWSEVIRIQNASSSSRYPRVVYALVFEHGGLLWFYTDTDGTQSLSQYIGRLAEEKADLGSLLRGIDPGFVRFAEVTPSDARASFSRGELPNGCFVESIAALRQRELLGADIEQPRLLSCYTETREGQAGHTVLTYRSGGNFFLIDPGVSSRPQSIPMEWADNPKAIATRVLEGAAVKSARWVPTDPMVSVLVARASNPAPAFSPERTTPHVMQ